LSAVSGQRDGHVDVAATHLRVRAGLVRRIDQHSCDIARQAGQGDIESRLQEVTALTGTKVDFGIDKELWQLNP
jgi:hypothetical protein